MAKHISDTINIGVCDAFFIPEGTELSIYLGHTKDGAEVTYEANYHEITTDQTGTTPLEDVLIGESVTVTMKLLTTTKKHIAAVFPTSSIIGAADDPEAVTFGQRPGLRATHHSGTLILHPISMGGDTSNDIIVYRTANVAGFKLSLKLEEEWVLECEFKGYFDGTRPPGDQLYRIGNDSQYTETYRRVTRFWITPSNPTVKIGETAQFRANALYEDGSQFDVTEKCTWVTADPTIISLSGTVPKIATALDVGSAVIRADYIGYSCTTTMSATQF